MCNTLLTYMLDAAKRYWVWFFVFITTTSAAVAETNVFEPEICEGSRFSGGLLSIEEAIVLGVCRSYSLRSTEKAVEARRFDVYSALGAFLPTVSLSAESVGQTKKLRYLDYEYRSIDKADIKGYGVRSELVLFDGGATLAKVSKAQYSLAAASAVNSAQMKGTVYTVADAWIKAMGAELAMSAAIESGKNYASNYEYVKKTASYGLATKADEAQALAALLQIENDKLMFERDLSEAKGRLAVLIGAQANIPIELNIGGLTKLKVPDFSEFKKILYEALGNNDELSRLVALEGASRAAVSEVKSGLYPKISIGISTDVGRTAYKNGSDSYGLDSVGNTTQLYLSASWTIFEGFSRINQIKASGLEVASLLDQRKAVVDQIQSDLWSAITYLRTAEKALNLTTELLTAATEANDMTLKRYKAGVVGIVDLLNAQSTLTNSKQRQATALSQFYGAYYLYLLRHGSISAINK